MKNIDKQSSSKNLFITINLYQSTKSWYGFLKLICKNKKTS